MALPKINWKKLALILGFIAVVIVIALILYFVFLQPIVAPVAPPPPPTAPPPPLANLNVIVTPPPVTVVPPPAAPTPPAIAPPLPISATASPTGFTAITAAVPKETSGVTLAANGQDVLYYDKESSKFFRLDRQGKSTLLSDQAFYNVSKVTWAPNTSAAVLEYADGSKSFYNFLTKEQDPLPSQWKDFSFAPTSDKIAFKEMNFDPENRWVSVANANGSGLRAVENLGTEDSNVLVSWSPNNQVVALFRQSVNADQAQVYFIGLYGENFKSLKVEGRDLRALWSPQGDRLLYSVYSFESNYNPSLWAADAKGDAIGSRRINFKLATWADKCTFADNVTVYCAVPITMDSGTGYFPELADNTPDAIYKLNLDTGAKVKVAQPFGGPTIGTLMISSDQKFLYFTDKNTNQIYKINI